MSLVVRHQAGAYPCFCSMNELLVFLLLPRWDASQSQGYPSIEFAGTDLQVEKVLEVQLCCSMLHRVELLSFCSSCCCKLQERQDV